MRSEKKKNTIPVWIGLLLVSFACCVPVQAVDFQPLGDLPGGDYYSIASDISTDGRVVVGCSRSASTLEGFRWENGVMTSLQSGFYSSPGAISADGVIIVGGADSPNGAFRWIQNSGFDFFSNDEHSFAGDTSADGSVIVGSTWDHGVFVSRCWQVGVPIQPCPGESDAFAVSADGSVVVGVNGYVLQGSGTQGNGFRWTASEGVTYPYPAAAYGISDDGSVVAGEEFYWTATGGLDSLEGTAYAVSADGSLAVGQSNSGVAFVWDATHGMREIQEILELQGLDLTGWTLTRANAIAQDNLTIVGYGVNPQGCTEGWIATIPEPGSVSFLLLGALALPGKAKRRNIR